MKTIDIGKIRIDGGTQPRAQIDMITVAEYAEAMQAGAKFPPVIVFYDGTDYWLADGFHRYHAARQANVAQIDCDVRKGTVRDAILFSVGANDTHGMRRTNADKRRAVTTLLNDKEWRKWPQSKIAETCNVTKEYVSRLKSELSIDRSIDKITVERGGTVYEMDTANIGKGETRGEVVSGPAGNYLKLNNGIKKCEICGQLWAADIPYCPYCNVSPAARAWHAEQEDKKPHIANNSGNNEWYTPSEYIEAACAIMGTIDLDPASSDEANTVVGASLYYTIETDGLDKQWRGNVWLNPPYASDWIEKFAGKIIFEYSSGRVDQAIVLVNNATETVWFQSMASMAKAICFPRSRVKFWGPDGKTGAPLQGQALIYFGPDSQKFCEVFSEFGLVLWKTRTEA